MKKIILGGLVALGLATGASAADVQKDIWLVSSGMGVINDKGAAFAEGQFFTNVPYVNKTIGFTGGVTSEKNGYGEVMANVFTDYGFWSISVDAGVGFESYEKIGKTTTTLVEIGGDPNDLKEETVNVEDKLVVNKYAKLQFGTVLPNPVATSPIFVSVYGTMGSENSVLGTNIGLPLEKNWVAQINVENKFNDTENGAYEANSLTAKASIGYAF